MLQDARRTSGRGGAFDISESAGKIPHHLVGPVRSVHCHKLSDAGKLEKCRANRKNEFKIAKQENRN
jgi:hypothetical protein